MERVLSQQNMHEALKQVRRNKGSGWNRRYGDSGPRPWLIEHWVRIRENLGTYKPLPEAGWKSQTGRRSPSVGIPTVVDRLIQQALHQELYHIFLDPGFSWNPATASGNTTMRGGGESPAIHRGGLPLRVVDMDLEKFFDRVNHDMLMARVARKVTDKRAQTHPSLP